jgi:hypothetical protein
MRRPAILIILVFFANALTGFSMFMLSIEKGRVYVEPYSLGHILKTAKSLQAENKQTRQPELGSYRYLSHDHIQLTTITIPERRNKLRGATLSHRGIDSLPTSQMGPTSSQTASSSISIYFPDRLKLPIPPLLQSSVLLI